MTDPFIYTSDDVLRMLDELLAGRGGSWWDEFFADRSKSCPFFVDWPDENLAAWFAEGLLTPGRVLELGCGNGRNADLGVYERASLGGGLGYQEQTLRALWDRPPFSVRVLRQMRKTDAREPYFGEDFLWTLLAVKEDAEPRRR